MLTEQVDSGNKVKIKIQPTKIFTRFDVSHPYTEHVSPIVLS